jgi:tRNA(Ile)-lysidine synthase
VTVERPLEVARESGLIVEGEPLLVLLSGGGDSVALLDIALRMAARVSALHVNYGLREGAGEDEEFCRELGAGLGVHVTVERVPLGAEPEAAGGREARRARGNLQERARDARYALAERLAEGDYAAAHTATDQAETVLYRLAVSPGSRALLGMEPRRGRLVRPLLRATRAELRDYLRSRGLDWREDPSNADRRFARARVRHDVLDALRELSPAAERTIAETALQLRDEADVLRSAAADALEELGGGPAVAQSDLRRLSPALARLVLRGMAEAVEGGPRSLSREEADAILRLGGDRGGTRALDLGGGLRAVSEYGTLRFTRDPDAAPPEPAPLAVPGRARFGDWEVEALPGEAGDVSVRSDALGGEATVRAWRDGDRMRPVGVGGAKSLQDLFTDRKVPRALRRTLPVVEAGGQIVWVAGVALDERFAAGEGEEGAVGLSARRPAPT